MVFYGLQPTYNTHGAEFKDYHLTILGDEKLIIF